MFDPSLPPQNSGQVVDNLNLLTNSQLPNRETSQSRLKRKKQHLRNVSRGNQIENMKKAVRFDWNANLTLEYLKSIQYKTVESQEILIDAIEHQNLQYLVDLIVSADPLFKTAVLSQCYRLLSLIQARFDQPSSILLLGNLCALYHEFIQASQTKKFITRLMNLMAQIKMNLKNIEICSWTATQMSREPHLLNQKEVMNCLPQLYSVMLEVSTRQSSKQLRTHLCRLVSQFSAVMQFPSQFLYFLVSIEPSRQIDKLNMYIAISTQIKMATYSENTDGRVKILDYLLMLHEKIEGKLPNSKENSIYNLVSTLMKKSEPELALYVSSSKFTRLLLPYKYANKPYYGMIYEMLLKINDPPMELLEQLRSSDLLQNLINDISDGNYEIGFLCLRCVEIIVGHVLSNGEMEYMEWLLGLELENQVEIFLANVGANEQLAKYGEKLLDMVTIV